MARNPGLEGQASARTRFRVVGLLLVATGLVMLVLGVVDLFSTMTSESFDGPERFWMAFVGLPLLAVGGWCVQAGFLGVAVPRRSCTGCGGEQEASAHFCNNCGTALG